MAWSWTPMPRRLLRDHRVLRLSRTDRAVLFSLYLGADEHGRFNADEMSLRVALGIVDGEVLAEPVARLNEAGLVHLYIVNGNPYGVLDAWDADLGIDMRKRRPASILPDPPLATWELARCEGTYRGGEHEPDRTLSGSVPDAVRTPSGPNRGEDIEEIEEIEEIPPVPQDGNVTPRRAALMEQMRLIQGGDDG